MEPVNISKAQGEMLMKQIDISEAVKLCQEGELLPLEERGKLYTP